MMWRKFIVSLALLSLSIHAYPCYYWSPEIDGLYMFKTYSQYAGSYYSESLEREQNVDFWYTYVNGNVSKKDIESALYEGRKDDITTGRYAFFRYLQQTRDSLVIRYWTITKLFAEYTSDPWYYPTKADRQTMTQLAQEVLMLEKECNKAELKERYMMQLMRISFYLGDYDLCAQLWKMYEGNFKDKQMEQKCRSYYAGTLFYSGQYTEAADLYAEAEDWGSLHYYRAETDFMRSLYQAKPSSKAFEYFVQEYLNDYQDNRAMIDSRPFVKLCEQVLKEKKSDNLVLWQSALAHVAFLDGDVKKAVNMIERASNMGGSPMAIENMRMLRLLYHAADGDVPNYDDKINQDLPFLLQKLGGLENFWAENNNGEHHYVNMTRRIVFQYMLPHYNAIGNSNVAVALLNAYDEAHCFWKDEREMKRKDQHETGSYDYMTNWFSYLDTTSIENVKSFLTFVKSGGKTGLEKNLIKMGYVRESMVNELIGTKYMRINDFETALQYLRKVSSSYLRQQNITEDLQRNPFREKWFEVSTERGSYYKQYNPARIYAENPGKVQFCMIMLELKRLINVSADAQERAACAYAYAVGLEQSHSWCWALTQYADGSIASPEVFFQWDYEMVDGGWDYRNSSSYYQQQLYKELYAYLDKAEEFSNDRELKVRCQYMRSYIELDELCQQRQRSQIMKDYQNTEFYRAEMIHCDRLSMYR